MKLVTLNRLPVEYRDYVRRQAVESDCAIAIDEPCEVYDREGKLVLIYDRHEGDVTELEAALQRIEYQTSTRTGGLVTTSRIFGTNPRLERRQRAYCTMASIARTQPAENAIVCGIAPVISARYRLRTPDVFRAHEQVVGERVKPEWRMPGSVFTSGIINNRNALHYHFDAGNFENVLSCMLVLRKNMTGGWFCVPEYGVRFMFHDRSVLMFDGQKILHGVTAMQPSGEPSYRFSIVFYSLKGAWRCMTMDEELANARQAESVKLGIAA